MRRIDRLTNFNDPALIHGVTVDSHIKLADVTVINISRYLYPYPPSQHTLNWSFWTHIASHVKTVFLISTINGPTLKIHEEKNIRFIGIPSNYPEILGVIRYLATAHKLGSEIASRSQRAVIWASDDIWGNLVAARLAEKFAAPYLLELQGNVFSPPRAIASWLHRLVQSIAVARGVKTASIVRVCCDDHRKRMAELDGSKCVSVIPTRVDTRLFDPAKFPRDDVRRSFGVATDEIVFITVSSLVARKGVHVFLRAFARIKRAIPSARYWIVGDGPYRSKLESAASATSESVTFFGRLPHSEIVSLLAASDVFVLPSFGEGMPRAIQEAQAMALPVIATNVDGIPEQVIDGKTGIIVPPGDSAALYRAALILDNASTRIRMGRSGREHIQSNFSQDAVFAQWIDLLLGLACEARG